MQVLIGDAGQRWLCVGLAERGFGGPRELVVACGVTTVTQLNCRFCRRSADVTRWNHLGVACCRFGGTDGLPLHCFRVAQSDGLVGLVGHAGEQTS